MAREPIYPKDAKIENVAEARSGAADAAASAKSVDPRLKKQLVTAGVAVGIGSAAIVAALLYAGRNRKKG